MSASPALVAYLAELPGRCPSCGFHSELQGHRGNCPQRNEGQRRAVEGMSRADAAHPRDVALVERAIDAACATGEPFSANDFRHLVPDLEQPNVIGSRIRARLNAKGIKNVGYVRSSLPGTHAHKIGVYRAT